MEQKKQKNKKGSRRFTCVEHATFEMLLQYCSPIPILEKDLMKGVQPSFKESKVKS